MATARTTEKFVTQPEICFQFGPTEYVTSIIEHFKIGDSVLWNISQTDRVKPLEGQIEFLGQNEDSTHIYAVVNFNQSTCHLPGHISSPPSNRNLVSVDQLVKKGLGQWVVNATNERVILTGNCIAKAEGFEPVEMAELQKDDRITVIASAGFVEGTVIVTGNLLSSVGKKTTVASAGIKFDSSLPIDGLEIEIQHNQVRQPCQPCLGGLLAFVPIKHLTYETRLPFKEPTPNEVTSSTDVKTPPRIPSAMTLPKPLISQVSSLKFVGNCIAKKHGIKQKTITGVSKSTVVVARKDGKSIEGTVRATVSINGLDDKNYVGMQFKNSFYGICTTDDVKHRSSQENDCEDCKGGKLVFVPECYFTNLSETLSPGIVFDVCSRAS